MIWNFIGIAIGLLSLILSWHFGTRRQRLSSKIREHEAKLSKLETYSSSTGYKAIVLDGFMYFSYVGSIVFIVFGISMLPIKIDLSPEFHAFLSGVLSGSLIGAGLVLFNLFILLVKANSSSESIKGMKAKIEKLKNFVGTAQKARRPLARSLYL